MDRLSRMLAAAQGMGGGGGGPQQDTNIVDNSETVYISSLALLKMLRHGRAGVPMEVMGLMLGEFVDDYTVRVVDVFAMPQSGTGVSVEAVDPVFQTKMMDMLRQTGRYVLSHWSSTPFCLFTHRHSFTPPLLQSYLPCYFPRHYSHSRCPLQRPCADSCSTGPKLSSAGTTLILALAAGSPASISTRNNPLNNSLLAPWPSSLIPFNR